MKFVCRICDDVIDDCADNVVIVATVVVRLWRLRCR